MRLVIGYTALNNNGASTMGYTHYFCQNRDFTIEEWASICDDTQTILDVLGDTLHVCGSDGYGNPEINRNAIIFNGCEEDGEAYETFQLNRKCDEIFNFCKTGERPYDIAVCAALIVAHHHAEDVLDIRSDGDHSDWYPALKFVNTVLGGKFKTPLRN